jgi:hypothetical protein
MAAAAVNEPDESEFEAFTTTAVAFAAPANVLSADASLDQSEHAAAAAAAGAAAAAVGSLVPPAGGDSDDEFGADF